MAQHMVVILPVFVHLKYALVLRLAIVDPDYVPDQTFVVCIKLKLLQFRPQFENWFY